MQKASTFLLLISVFSTLALAQDDSTPVQLVGLDGKKLSLTAEVVSQFARVEFEATERDGTKARYVGIELSKLIEKTGVPQRENLRGTWLGCFVVIEAKDGYRAVFSLAELDSSFADRRVYLVDSRNGMPLDDKHGPLQLIAPDEKRVSRWVRMVTSIRVVDSKSIIDSEKK